MRYKKKSVSHRAFYDAVCKVGMGQVGRDRKVYRGHRRATRTVAVARTLF